MKIENEIVSFAHCKKCLDNMPEGRPPHEWQFLEVGLTGRGIQVWCKLHDENIVHLVPALVHAEIEGVGDEDDEDHDNPTE